MMFRYTTLLLGVLLSQVVNSQVMIPVPQHPDAIEQAWLLNDVLDSVVNKIPLNTGGVICVTDKFVSIDTITTNKVKQVGFDSVTVGNFLKKNQKKISSKEFWGIATAEGQYSRLYRDKMYIVWETPTPYVYKLIGDWKTEYYFSETLLSPVILLNTMNIRNAGLSANSEEILNRFLEENNKAVAMKKEANKDLIINTSVNVFSVILQIMLFSAGTPHYHSGSQSHADSPQPQTGRRGR